MKMSEIYSAPPPHMGDMVFTRSNSPGAYDSQGRWALPPQQLDVIAVSENVKLLATHMHNQWNTELTIKSAIDERFAEMERRIKDAMSLMYYTRQFYPQIITEWGTAHKTKKRIGVNDPPQ